MKIYNTLTRKKEEFEPIEEGKVKHVCLRARPYITISISVMQDLLLCSILSESIWNIRDIRLNSFRTLPMLTIRSSTGQKKRELPLLKSLKKYIEEYYKDAAALNVKKANRAS